MAGFDPNYVSAAAAVVAAASTVVLTRMTSKYVKLTGQMAAEMAASRQASVYVDIEFLDSHRALFVIGNAGLSPALNVRLSVVDRFPWLDERDGFRALPVTQTGLPSLAPGRTLKYLLGSMNWDALKQQASTIEVKVTFSSESGSTSVRTVSFDLSTFERLHRRSFEPPEQDLVTAVSRIPEAIREGRRNHSMLFKPARCTACKEPLQHGATKCPHCWEVQPESRPPQTSS